ncbi:MAG: radical SAM protein [Acidimicrobiales bacterium]|nr:radical SAM protein [Acidimicrobiales bacterium]MCB9372787.1 radical SAM protein [Microthrixaceae bacterium]
MPHLAVRPYSACYAPSVQLYFDPSGEVRACCRNVRFPLGNVAGQRLTDLWEGARRHELVGRLAVDDWSLGCQGCGTEVAQEGRPGSYPASFDARAEHLGGGPDAGRWPTFFEFNLSNACNLQCLQCNGDLSSSIRIHREHRAPLPAVYGDEFFEDLAEFLPHLHQVQFAGGEPFLGAENYRAWDLIADVAPDLPVTVVTNATQWGPRVESVLERLAVGFVFSLDGIHEATYEAIRVGADIDAVLANVDRFCAYARERGTATMINHCLMVQNAHEFADLLLFADERDLPVNVSVVHHPGHCSIARLPHDDMRALLDRLTAQSPQVAPRLGRNREVWDRELARIASWVESGTGGAVDDGEFAASAHEILDLPRQGDGPYDDGGARAELTAFADAPVHVVTVGPDDVIRSCTPAPDELFGVPGTDLVGRPVADLRDLLTRRHGTMTDYRVTDVGIDRIDAAARCGDLELRLSLVAVRDEQGWADEGRVLVGRRSIA